MELSVLDKQDFVTLTSDDLVSIEGGLVPIVIGGVVIGWKAIAVGVGATAVLFGAGAAAGYYANRP